MRYLTHGRRASVCNSTVLATLYTVLVEKRRKRCDVGALMLDGILLKSILYKTLGCELAQKRDQWKA